MESVQGYLEIMDKGFGFLRNIEENFQPKPENTYVPNSLIRKLSLKEGSFIEGFGEQKGPGNPNLALIRIEKINDLPFDEFINFPLLQDQISINPFERYHMTQGPDDITGKALDIITPIGMGQRGLIISPPKSGKTTILRHMANSVVMNHPETKVFVLLVDERPEEVTDFQRGLKDAHVLYSSADQQIGQHMRMTRLAMHTAIRCAEIGQDAIVFIDSLTRMTRAFNNDTDSHGKTMTGGLGANAMEFPRKIFGAARKLENGGSLTIIATILVDTGSRMDDIIFQEFKGTGNMDLFLSRECAENRIWPAININKSGTRKEDLIMDKDEYETSVEIRRAVATKEEKDAMTQFISYLG
ncbi:MAG: transcription termination factor Rho [Proteobacteria bacterium]|nr:transcription termination factor Rho [Pseudomonadota bacterium]MBU1585368.1 transcription termination factor Rho [Pseudomonadota bacterium]MBU2454924.1 transcription termination factor Rho [Pseudomonadota bacterium]MBU2630555.1 transcription termination factor Rho [Pseudomonadota bacterium]